MRNFFKSQFIMLLISWLMTLIYVSFGGSIFHHSFKVFMCIFVWVPGIIAYHFAKKDHIKLPMFKLKGYDFFYMILLPIGIVFLAALVSLPLCEIRSSESLKILLPIFLQNMPLGSMFLCFVCLWILTGTILTATLYFAIIIGSELMFRGYAWEKLKYLGFWKASLVIGLIWGLWGAPIILIGMEYPEQQLYGVLVKSLYLILLTPLMLYIRIQTKALLACAFFYGFLIHLSNIFPYLLRISSGHNLGLQGITGLVTLGLINLILFLKIRKTPLLEYEL